MKNRRTKVVLRHLPPTLSQSMLLEHVDSRFAGRYNWFNFRPAKTSLKHQSYSKAYIDFRNMEDVTEFAEFFDGHMFVNEKGTQFKTIVEYAPSQRVPKHWLKKDAREGTILKDPAYMEFLEFLAKPVENLPSAEIQLERKEAERAGSAKDAPIVTPLMDYVRQKRAVTSGARSISNGKSSKSVGGTSSRSPSSTASRRGSEKRTSTTMYVQRDSSKVGNSKDKSYILASKCGYQQLSDKSSASAPGSWIDVVEGEIGRSVTSDSGKKKILLLKGKEKESPNVSGGSLAQQNVSSALKNSPSLSALKLNQHQEVGGRIIRSILLKDARQNQSAFQSDQIQDKDMRPPRPPSMQLFQKDTSGANEDKVVGNEKHVVHIEKQERRSRNRDRPDRGVWAPLRRADSSQASNGSLSSGNPQSSQVREFVEGGQGETKNDLPIARGSEFRPIGIGRHTNSSTDNGNYKHGGRHGLRDVDDTSIGEGKPVRRGGTSAYNSLEKQVWVQKSSSGS
ncbi:regulator of nonsense transcripts UPF3-like isoform X2 [Solanum lycopersicum]|uniref:regulator of nonsense transcripts UPF3-like isoform X2 n=2 Tax=Solanum lycopersicum TaxID=4081 RepID=UPI000532CC10|nr:regulator of nonsense transcripts UPF3-like isoform X2 [Solanum lycopersicum]